MFLMDTNDVLNLNSNGEKQHIVKVNFNTASANNYLTNEAYKTLRTNLLFCGSEIKVIVITSSQKNEGKSTVSTEISKSLAEADKKTILIDADMRKSVLLKKSIKSHSIRGLSELLSGQAKLCDVLYNTQNPNFDVIFSGHFPPNPVELLASENFKNLLSGLREIYDYVIIDSPPLSPVIDAAVICSVADAAILVISPGNIRYTEAVSVKEQILKSGCKLLGTVLNNTTPKQTNYYKHYYKGGKYKYYGNKSTK